MGCASVDLQRDAKRRRGSTGRVYERFPKQKRLKNSKEKRNMRAVCGGRF